MNDSAITALVGTIIGGTLTIASNLLLEHVRAAAKAQQLAHAVAGEASALIRIVEARRYVADIKALADLARKGDRRGFKVVARKNYLPTIEANLDSIGSLPADLPILVPRLLTFSKATLEDFERLACADDAEIAGLDLVAQYDELGAVLEEAMSAARQIVNTVATVYGSPHGRLPIGLRWRLRLPLLRRIGSVILGAFIAIYLAVITYTYADRPHTTKDIAELVLLWLIGLIGLGILARAWRKLPSRTKNLAVQ